jgi:very-short-patch-repair endonuclease
MDTLTDARPLCVAVKGALKRLNGRPGEDLPNIPPLRGEMAARDLSSPLRGEVAGRGPPEGASELSLARLTAWIAPGIQNQDGAGVPSPETDRARQLRKNMTASEWRVWSYLKGRQMDGWKSRRQAPIGPYIVDFVCFAARLVVELDGNSHDDVVFDHDERRQAWLESQGFRVLRLSADNPEMDPIQGVWDAIDLALSELPASVAPSARQRRGPTWLGRPLRRARPATSPASGEDKRSSGAPATSPASGED